MRKRNTIKLGIDTSKLIEVTGNFESKGIYSALCYSVLCRAMFCRLCLILRDSILQTAFGRWRIAMYQGGD